MSMHTDVDIPPELFGQVECFELKSVPNKSKSIIKYSVYKCFLISQM